MPNALSPQVRGTVLHATRTMFPHDGLPDEAYDKVVSALEALPQGPDTLAAGAAELDGDRPFVDLGPEERLAALQRVEGSDFFTLVHATAVVELYDNPLVWKAFGYEGPSAHLGGYVNRGFDDLDWLPEPKLDIDWQDAPSHATPETTDTFNKAS
jgi:hypothetical protein